MNDSAGTTEDLIQRLLREQQFKELFVEELGWDRFNQHLRIELNDTAHDLAAVAQKRGLAVFHCSVASLQIFDRGLLRRIQRRVAKYAHEHIIIYSDPGNLRQVWHWATRPSGGGTLFHREHPFRAENPPPEFLRRLSQLRVTLADEERISLVRVSQSVAKVLDRRADEPIFFRNPRYLYECARLEALLSSGSMEDLHRFVTFHDRLAVWMAKRYEYTGVDIEDLQQEARLGLYRAAERFDVSRGTAFSTYAFHWVRQFCQRKIPSYRMVIRIRFDQFWRYAKLMRRAERMHSKDGRWSEREWFERQLEGDRVIGCWPLQLERAWNVGCLHREHRGAARRLACPSLSPWEEFSRQDSIRAVRAAVERLDPREAAIIQSRFGFHGREQTLAEVAECLGVTRQRIGQIEIRALEFLAGELRSYCDARIVSAAESPTLEPWDEKRAHVSTIVPPTDPDSAE